MGQLISKITNNLIEAGCDEAGRGCFAGPVVAAAVVLPADFSHTHLNDSKQVSEKKRIVLRKLIEEFAISFAVSFVSQVEIDQINILNASILAMHRAIDQLAVKPQHLLIDGNRFKPYQDIPHSCFIKGDSRFMSIAAASILAKTYRDEYMEKIDLEYPSYDWKQNKGYPTQSHREAIQKYGPCEHHRHSFTLLPANQIRLFD